MFDLLATLLAFFYDLIPDYAAAIALLTLTVMLVLLPLTWKGTRSMLALQRLQPEIKKLQQQHKHDRQALNEAMMAFYKEHQINPLSGCLPTLLQFPVFIVMYNVIRGLTSSDGPKYLDQSTDLYQSLKDAGGEMVSFGVDLGLTATDASGGDAIALYGLIALVTATSFWQSYQMTARNPQAAQNPQTKILTRVFPIMMAVISIGMPGGLVFYFLVSNLLRIGQQSLMYRLDPALAATVKQEVKEIDAKADEIERRPRAKPPAPAPPPVERSSGRVTDRGNGARRQQQGKRPTTRSGRKRKKRR